MPEMVSWMRDVTSLFASLALRKRVRSRVENQYPAPIAGGNASSMIRASAQLKKKTTAIPTQKRSTNIAG